MLKPRIIVAALAVCALAAHAGASLADEQKAETAPTMPDDVMKAWLAYATPGPQHKVLDAFIGTWDAKMSFWTKPGAEPVISGGKSEQTWVLGGRFVMQTFQGEDASRSFSGMGFTGYNNASKKYESVWMDTESTGMIRTAGTIDEAGTAITQTGEYMDPVTAKMRPVKYVTHLASPTEFVFEMYEPGAGGTEFKTLEAVYTKRP